MSQVKRYKLRKSHPGEEAWLMADDFAIMNDDENQEWIKWEDVKAAVETMEEVELAQELYTLNKDDL